MLTDYVPTWAMAIAGLPDGARESIEQRMHRIEIERGEFLYEEGKPNPYLYLVCEGRVKSCFSDAGGRECIGRVVGPGILLGVVTNLIDTPPSWSIQALDRTTADRILRTDLLACMEEFPRFAINIARLVAAMYNERIIATKTSSAPAAIRLGKILYDLATLQGRRDAGDTAVIEGITHQELASMVGASRSWVTVMLRAYEEQGVLTCRRSALDIRDVERLKDYVQHLERAST